MSEMLVESAYYIGTIAVAFALYQLWSYVKAYIKEKRESGEWAFLDALDSLARVAVQAAEQMKAKHGFDNSDALEYAINVVADYFESKGIEIPVSVIVAAIESAVWKSKSA